MFRLWTITALCLLMGSVSQAIERPPEPNDVPFPWDPNQCASAALDWMQASAGEAIVYTFHVVNIFGEDVTLTASDPNITTHRTTKTNEEGYWLQTFQLLWTPFGEGVSYINLHVVDQYGRSDSRTLLVLVLYDDPPIIYPPDRPVITSWIRGAKDIYQISKKQGKRVLGAIHTWNPRSKITNSFAAAAAGVERTKN